MARINDWIEQRDRMYKLVRYKQQERRKLGKASFLDLKLYPLLRSYFLLKPALPHL